MNSFLVILILIFSFYLYFTLKLRISSIKRISSNCNATKDIYDIIFVLTVWKRNNYKWQLELLMKQNYSRHYNILIVIFQNANHVNVSINLQFSNKNNNINIKFIHSDIETGYYSRFLVPLLYKTKVNTYFFIIDDDIRWGYLYFNNMVELIDKGYLATKIGRYIDRRGYYTAISFGKLSKHPILCKSHIEFDYGGHIWGGKVEWLKILWTYPPPFYDTCEDFWISAVLKTTLGIKTATPKCTNITLHSIGEICACDDFSNKHESGIIGNKKNNDKNYYHFRISHIKQIMKKYNYSPIHNNLDYSNKIKKEYIISPYNFTVIDDLKMCTTWIG